MIRLRRVDTDVGHDQQRLKFLEYVCIDFAARSEIGEIVGKPAVAAIQASAKSLDRNLDAQQVFSFLENTFFKFTCRPRIAYTIRVASSTKKKPQPGRLRIVAGNWRSRLLEIADVPKACGRPRSASARPSFNWLSPRIDGCALPRLVCWYRSAWA